MLQILQELEEATLEQQVIEEEMERGGYIRSEELPATISQTHTMSEKVSPYLKSKPVVNEAPTVSTANVCTIDNISGIEQQSINPALAHVPVINEIALQQLVASAISDFRN